MIRERKNLPTLSCLVMCLISTALAQVSGWGQDTRDLILAVHNDYRRSEGGCYMSKLEYDMKLEDAANERANDCQYPVDQRRGENVAYSTSHDTDEKLINDSLAGWFNTKENEYRTDPYYQMVRHDTKSIGCYATRCPSLYRLRANPLRNAWYLVCFYEPSTDIQSEPEPFQTSCETPCHPGQTEQDGLCEGEAAAPSCEDKEENCGFFQDEGMCSTFAFLEEDCKKTCKFC